MDEVTYLPKLNVRFVKHRGYLLICMFESPLLHKLIEGNPMAYCM